MSKRLSKKYYNHMLSMLSQKIYKHHVPAIGSLQMGPKF